MSEKSPIRILSVEIIHSCERELPSHRNQPDMLDSQAATGREASNSFARPARCQP